MESKRLGDLGAGCSAKIVSLNVCDSLRRRLLDLGMTHGTDVTCLRHGFGKRISAYSIRGAVIAVRRCDADNINIICK